MNDNNSPCCTTQLTMKHIKLWVVSVSKLSLSSSVSLSLPHRLVFESLVFCCSSMTSAEKQRVKQLAKNLRACVNVVLRTVL